VGRDDADGKRALAMPVACSTPASAAARATMISINIVTDIIGCIVGGMRERPPPVDVRHQSRRPARQRSQQLRRARHLRPDPKLLAGVLVLALAFAPAAQAVPVMSGDPQNECVWSANYDPAPFMQEHHASILRLVVTSVHPDGVFADGRMVIPPYAQALAGEMACVRNAQAEGYPVLISFEFPNTWLPSQVAGWFGQVLSDFPNLWGVGIGNEQDLQYTEYSETPPSFVTVSAASDITTYTVKQVVSYETRKITKWVWVRRHKHRRRIRRVVSRPVRHVNYEVDPHTTTVETATTRRASPAEQYRLDYDAAEPVVASLEPGALISFGNAFPLGEQFILDAWGFGGRPAGVGAISISGYWLGDIPSIAAFAQLQGLPLWVPEDNPNGPGGDGSTTQPPGWQAQWNAAVAQARNWTLDDFYS
jgi:hypothetical protein